MISIILYGRNDSHGYNLHKRAVLSLNCLAEVLDARGDEILFTDYNTPDDHPSFPEAVRDLLTPRARRLLRVFRVRPADHHARFAALTHLNVLEPVARNVALRRSNPDNRWVLFSNTDMLFWPRPGRRWLFGRVPSLSRLASGLPDGHYHTPRFELPEALWESFDRTRPVRVLDSLNQTAERLHLKETVSVDPPSVYDTPGDFQLLLRSDLFAIDACDESMVHGWHIDANIAHRLTLLRGPVTSLAGQVAGFHCDHTRQATLTHGRQRIENDWARHTDQVERPDLPEQRERWGLPDAAVEEIRLDGGSGPSYVPALLAALPLAPTAPYRSARTDATYNDLSYAPSHVLPYLMSALEPLPRSLSLGYFGCRPRMLELTRQAWAGLGFTGPVHAGLNDDGGHGDDDAAGADLLIFEFGLPVHDDDPGAPGLPNAWSEADLERLTAVRTAFYAVAADERARQAAGRAPRRAVMINALHNGFEALAAAHLAFVHTPFTTRLRLGAFLPATAPAIADRHTLARWVQQRLGRALPPPPAEIETLERWARDLLSQAPPRPAVTAEMAAAALPLLAMLEFPGLDRIIPGAAARRAAVTAAVVARRPCIQLRPDVDLPPGDENTAPGALPSPSRVAGLRDWENPAWRNWATRFFGGTGTYNTLTRSAWVWERTQFLAGLDQLGVLRPDARVAVVATLPDPLSAVLSELTGSVEVLNIAAAPTPAPDDVAEDGQHPSWERPAELLSPARHRVRRVTVPQDTPAAPSSIDVLLLPHNTAFRGGLYAMPDLLAWAEPCLAPGGVIAFTAEVALNRDAAEPWLTAGLIADGVFERAVNDHTGWTVAGPFAGTIDDATLDRFADGDDAGSFPVMVTRSGTTLHTSSLWFLTRRGGDVRLGGWERVRDALIDHALPRPMLRHLSKTRIGRRDGRAIVVGAGEAKGHVLYGPFLRLPAGFYHLRFAVTAEGAAPGTPVMDIEAVVGGNRILAHATCRAEDLADGPLTLDVELPPELAVGGTDEDRLEVRVNHRGTADLRIEAVDLIAGPSPAGGRLLDRLLAPLLPAGPLLALMETTSTGVRDGDTVTVAADAPTGHFLYGPFLRLPAGLYHITADITAAGVSGTERPVVAIDVAVGGQTILTVREIRAGDLAGGPVTVSFQVPEHLGLGGAQEERIEFRFAHTGAASLRVTAITLGAGPGR